MEIITRRVNYFPYVLSMLWPVVKTLLCFKSEQYYSTELNHIMLGHWIVWQFKVMPDTTEVVTLLMQNVPDRSKIFMFNPLVPSDFFLDFLDQNWWKGALRK